MLCKKCNQNEVSPGMIKNHDYQCNSCRKLQRESREVKLTCGTCGMDTVPLYRAKRCHYICNPCRKKARDTKRNRILDHYGRICTYCGSSTDLQLDHVNGDGKEDHGRAWQWHDQLIREGFPPICQIVCRQCNIAKQTMKDCEFRAWIDSVYAFIHRTGN